ncbi:MAG TPA: cation:proton antiporter [Tepidisphaeraceae bacterium]|jgi:Kef-type K+ transport system membrane component KefB/nucleotide-binding universal stress UspA family protein
MHVNVLLTVLIQIALILALSRIMGMLFRLVQQPQVVGEMLAGIMLGPSLFGLLAPNLAAHVFPPATIPLLNILSQVGVIFFLFLVGLELDPKLLRNRGHAAVVISHVSIIAPFLLGAGLTLILYEQVFNSTPAMRFTSVALFMGAAMSITAFPVLARILTERNLHKTNVGAVAITCAAVDDVTAWCMLAFVVAFARATGIRSALATACFSVTYIIVMFLVVRPLLARIEAIYERQGRLSQNVVAAILLLVLASAFTTELIGIHALFGAFLMGAMMPKGTRFIRHLSEKLEDYTVVLLLPIFFAYTGLKTQINLLNHQELWGITALIIAVACAGKFGGSTIAARACGLPWRESAAIGILMNTRGLMELVILNIGRELGVITDAVFAMMVIMALVTTALTTPILHWVYPERLFGPVVPAAKTAAKKMFSVLIPVSDPSSGAPLIRLASTLAGADASGTRLLALHLRPPVDHEAYRSGLDEVVTATDPTLEPLLNKATEIGMEVEPITLTSIDVADDIAAVARVRQVNFVLMGFHKPVIGHAILGGTVHRVMSSAPADVGIFVNRGLDGSRRILVPYLGSSHDRLALEMASRLAKSGGAQVTVLHVVAPDRSNNSLTLGAKSAVDRAFTEPGQQNPVQFKVIEHDSPVAAILDAAKEYDLVIIGVGEEWGLESQVFGFRPQRIAQDCPTSLLIVRKHAS